MNKTDFSPNDIERFWANVDTQSEECWLWLGWMRNGYGGFCIRKKSLLAHRVSYALTYGEVPSDMYICHHCDNPSCVRPSHLFLGTPSDNMKDASEKGRLRGKVKPSQGFQAGARHWTHTNPSRIPRGSSRAGAKLSEEIINDIKHDVLYMSQAKVAHKYGVSQSTISRACSGKTWAHVPLKD